MKEMEHSNKLMYFYPTGKIDKTMHALLTTLVTIEALNIILQIIGLKLLFSMYTRRGNDTQRLFLFNLASSQLLWNVVAIIKDTMMRSSGEVDLDKEDYHLRDCIEIFFSTGIGYNVILAMFYFTGDRLLHFLLHAKYERYWSISKSKILILVTWLSNILLSFLLAGLHNLKLLSEAIHKNMTRYFLLSIMCIYLIFSIIVYCILFKLYRQSEKARLQKSSMSANASTYHIFKNTKFYIAVMIVATYLLLTVIPSMVFSIWKLTHKENKLTVVMLIYSNSTRLSHTVDAVLYIYFKK